MGSGAALWGWGCARPHQGEYPSNDSPAEQDVEHDDGDQVVMVSPPSHESGQKVEQQADAERDDAGGRGEVKDVHVSGKALKPGAYR